MAGKEVFQDHLELDRLAVQNRLLKAYEQPIYQRLVSGRSNLRLLDVGCNDGSKTVDRFSIENISRVIGLEYHEELAKKAQAAYGGGGFAFYQCDVESVDFARRLSGLMDQNKVDAFDLIYVSFVLMHLKAPAALLETLRGFLAPGGRLIIVEADDAISAVSTDPDHLFQDFLRILSFDPLSGDRTCGGSLPALLAEHGYQQITIENTTVGAGVGELQRKKELFDVFFSYLPQDILLLLEQEPDNARYAACAAWLERHYEALRSLILAERTEISMGISIITCLGE